MFYRVARYNIPIYGGYCKIKVPLGAEPLGIITDTVSTVGQTPLFISVNEPISPNKAVVETEELELLVVGDGSPYEVDEKKDSALMYLGFAAWDNGYRIQHVFQVVPDIMFEDEDLNYTVEPEFSPDDFIEMLENPEASNEDVLENHGQD